jgi:CRISPR-associated exonuclease Cas4
MLQTRVPCGAIFHMRSKRRREVQFDMALRRTTEAAVAQLHALIDSGQVPPPVLHQKCQSCSLHALCMPELVSAQDTYRLAAHSLFLVEA